MKVTLDDLERYGDTLDSIAEEASAVFARTMNQYVAEMTEMYGDASTWPKEQRDQMRDYAADLMVDLWNAYGDASSSVGSMLFEDTLGDGMPDRAVMMDHVSNERARQSARYWANNLFGDEVDVDRFIGGCSSFLHRQVSHSADAQILDGADELASKGKHVRYGRVPTGPSCGFCIMLASRGFVYASKESAGWQAGFNRFHDNCNCRVVAGYEGLEVEGYDYKGMYKRYKQCRETVGDTDQLQMEWDALTPEERDKYGRGERVIPLSEDSEEDAKLKKKLGAQADGFNDYVAHRICQEMDTRDREWLYSGKELPEPGREAGAKPKKKESDTADRLQTNGYRVFFRKPTGKGRTSDIYLVSGNDEAPIETKWEIKQPIGNNDKKTIGKNTIDHQFEDAIGQSRNLVLDVTVVASYPGISHEDMIAEAERLLLGKYSDDFDQVMVVNGNEIRKLKNR